MWEWALLAKVLGAAALLVLFFAAWLIARGLHKVIPDGRIRRLLFSRIRD
jgi:hypothetical protein